MQRDNHKSISHVAFADDSHWNKGRFRGLGLVTAEQQQVINLNTELSELLSESNIAEFKWEKLRTAKYRFAAIKMLDWAVIKAVQGIIRLDTLTWDIEDSRHKIARRDDRANLARMYYRLFKFVLQDCWPDGSVWGLYPDEHSAMDWENLDYFLGLADSRYPLSQDMFGRSIPSFRIKDEFKIAEISPMQSHESPLLQLADLFVGLCVFSRENYDRFELWLGNKSGQKWLFQGEIPSTKFSGSEEERFTVLEEFNKLCKQKHFRVSLKTTRGLKTFNPKNPLNFWWYEPQHELDKAPTKTRQDT